MCSQAERAGADRGTEQSPAWRVLVADHDLQVHAAARAAVQGLVLFGRPVVVLHAQDAARARHLLLQEDDLAVLLLDALLGGAASGGLAGFARQQAGRVNMRIVLRTEARSLALPMLARHDIGDHRRKAELSPQRLRAVLAGAVRAYVQHCRIDANRRSLARIVQSGAALMEQTDLRGFAAAVITQLAGLLGVAPQGLVCVRETGAASGCRVLAATGDFAARRRRLQTSNAALLLHRALVQGLPAHGGASGGLALPMGQHAGQAMAVYVHAPALREAPEPRLRRTPIWLLEPGASAPHDEVLVNLGAALQCQAAHAISSIPSVESERPGPIPGRLAFAGTATPCSGPGVFMGWAGSSAAHGRPGACDRGRRS